MHGHGLVSKPTRSVTTSFLEAHRLPGAPQSQETHMILQPQESLAWRVSSRCNSGTCVAVAPLADGSVAVRDTKHADGPILRISRDDWGTLVERVKAL
ncbi:DUF397 domain-containing protein [Nonomuraea sp. NPDC050663]|uniref:DUF397 domain-containing protein n=1 Tax=Nonomuraea sp. NPDC050663 TaxID=3364370 RepID=UPI0037ABD48B